MKFSPDSAGQPGCIMPFSNKCQLFTPSSSSYIACSFEETGHLVPKIWSYRYTPTSQMECAEKAPAQFKYSYISTGTTSRSKSQLLTCLGLQRCLFNHNIDQSAEISNPTCSTTMLRPSKIFYHFSFSTSSSPYPPLPPSLPCLSLISRLARDPS